MANYTAISLWTVPSVLIVIILISLIILIYCKCKKRPNEQVNQVKEQPANYEHLWKRNFVSEFNYKPYSYAKCRVLPPPPPMYDSVILVKGTNPSYTGPSENVTRNEEVSSCDHGSTSFK